MEGNVEVARPERWRGGFQYFGLVLVGLAFLSYQIDKESMAMKCLLLIVAFHVAAMGQVVMKLAEGHVDIEINGKPFTSLYQGADAPKPYLHPLRTVSGKQVTRGYPMEAGPDDPKDHQHHRGLWFTHGDVNGFDFWMNEFNYKSENRGVIKLVKLIQTQGGKKQGHVSSEYLWSSPKGEPLLKETTKITFYANPKDRRILDYEIQLEPLVDVKFGDTKEGSFALRLTPELDEKHTGKMTNAEGKSGEKEVWGKPSPWVDYAGTLQGEAVGIAILDHPSNQKFPTYWHSRSYGLFAANRYGEHDFFNDKKRDGSVTYQKGQPVTFRYRVIIHAGDAKSAKIAEEFARWSR
jgi:hypothetical protein